MSTESSNGTTAQIKAISKRYIPAILYLAERMAASDKDLASKERTVILQLAEAANMKDFRHKKEFSEMDEDKACNTLDIEPARRAALVVLALILKADGQRRPEEHDYFRRVRTKLGADSIKVPVDLEAHKEMATRFFS